MARHKKVLTSYQKRVQKRLTALRDVFAKASIGDFSIDVPLYEEEDEFTETYVGVQIMLEVIRSQLTDLQQLNDRLETNIAELKTEIAQRKDLEARKDQFITILGHELRNPLAPIIYAAQLITMQLTAGEVSRRDLEENIAIIDRQSLQMSRLINDLLDISRILRGTLELKFAEVDLANIVHSAVEAAHPLMRKKSHSLSIDLPPERIVLNADALRLEQAIVNVLNNAAKYTPQGGEISVSARRDGENALVRIKDSGIGIPPEFIERMFDFLTRGEYSSRMKEGGLGIGLTVAKGVVQLHGGEISVQSEGPDKGAEFTILLPLLAHAPERVSNPFPMRATLPNDQPVQHRRILIVDDNRDHAQTLGKILREYGQEVRLAFDGIAAIQIVDTFQPQIIFLDLAMPELDGYSVARRIREDGHSEIQIVAVTGFGHPSDMEKTKAAGFDAHLVKPPRLDEILKVLA